jgi:hypothetical protein
VSVGPVRGLPLHRPSLFVTASDSLSAEFCSASWFKLGTAFSNKMLRKPHLCSVSLPYTRLPTRGGTPLIHGYQLNTAGRR